jgi:hypothetical protein
MNLVKRELGNVRPLEPGFGTAFKPRCRVTQINAF